MVCHLRRAARPAGRRYPQRVYGPSVRDHGRGGSRSRRQGPGEAQRDEFQKARQPLGRERRSSCLWTLPSVSGDSSSLPQEVAEIGGKGFAENFHQTFTNFHQTFTEGPKKG